jgi:TP901 family phage tail tape measure protein
MSDRTIRMILRAEVGDYKRQMAEAAAATDKIPAAAAKAETALGRMVQSARYNRESWDRAGQTMVAFGVATLGGLAAAGKAAIDWEAQWTGVLKTVSGSATELDALEGSLREMARTLPASHQEIAAVAEAAGQLGVQTPNVAAFTRVMIDLGETTNLSADEAATALAQLMNVMQTSADDVDNLGSAVVALGNNGASTERDIVLMAQRIAGAGAMIGMTEGDVLGLANALASVGIEAEAGGSAISKIMIDIATAVSTGSDTLTQWASVAGMSAADFSTAFKEAPAEAIASFVEGLGRMNDAGGDVFSTLADLGQADIRVTRALLTMANSGDLLRNSLTLGNDAWVENNALMLEAMKRYDTTAAKLEIAKGSINDAAIELGQVFLPAVADAAEGVAGFAQAIAGLPEPVQQVAGGLAAIVGSASLAGGAFLLLFPRVLETITAFGKLGSTAQAAWRTVGRTGVIVAAAGALLTLADAAQSASISSEELLNRLLAIESGAAGIDSLFADIGQGWADTLSMTGRIDTGSVDEFRASLEKLNETDVPIISDFNAMMSDITGMDGGLRQLGVRLRDVGAELGPIAQQDLPRAQEMFNRLAEAAGGDEESIRLLLGVMSPYKDALYAVANAQGMTLDETSLLALATGGLDLAQSGAGEAAAGLSGSTDTLVESYNAATGAVQELTEEQAAYRQELADLDASLVDGLGAYDNMITKNQEAAQAAADASADTGDSWEDFVDNFPATVAGYLDELQRMVDAQLNWETNMILLSGRVSQGVLDELARMGPEGAPLVAQLVDASDEELARLEELFAQRATTATGAFASTLDTAAPVIAAAAAQLGSGAAAEIARALADGTATIAEIMWDYKLQVEGFNPAIKLDTTMAYTEMQRFVDAYSNRTLVVRIVADAGALTSAQRAAYSSARSTYTGGWALGGYTGDIGVHEPAGIVHGREFVVSAPATARHRPLLEAINSGVRGYEGGGYVTPAQSTAVTWPTPASAGGSAGRSLVGLSIEGTLVTSWGPSEIRGVVRDELADAGSQADYRGRA